MATKEVLLARLSEAEDALHKLMLGQQTVKLEYDGKSVTYTASKSGELRAYIEELKVKTGTKSGRRGAARVWFK